MAWIFRKFPNSQKILWTFQNNQSVKISEEKLFRNQSYDQYSEIEHYWPEFSENMKNFVKNFDLFKTINLWIFQKKRSSRTKVMIKIVKLITNGLSFLKICKILQKNYWTFQNNQSVKISKETVFQNQSYNWNTEIEL